MNIDFAQVSGLVRQTKDIVFDEALAKSIRMKGKADFVTAVDTGISDFLEERLAALYPDIGFFCEETEGGLSDPCWILDPIDGTTNLVFDYRMSSVSLALYDGGQITHGVVFNPYSGEVFTAVRGEGAYSSALPGRLAANDHAMKDSLIEFGAGSTHKEGADIIFGLARDIFKSCLDIRRICSSALSICFIACGRIDGYFERVLKPWDYAAASLILEEAGGRLSDWQGNGLQYAVPTTIVAANRAIHGELLGFCRGK